MDAKPCLTVLDFVGQAHRQFRFDLRLRALLGGHRSELIRQVEQGFPALPSGCAIHLDRVVTEVVLANIRQSVGSTFASLVAELRAVASGWRDGGRDAGGITLAHFLDPAALDLSDVYRTAGWSWSRLRREAGLRVEGAGPEDDKLMRAMGRLLHVDDPVRLDM